MADHAFALIADRECSPSAEPVAYFGQLQPAIGLNSLLRGLGEHGVGTMESDDSPFRKTPHHELDRRYRKAPHGRSGRLGEIVTRRFPSALSIGLEGVVVSPAMTSAGPVWAPMEAIIPAIRRIGGNG